jgi:aminopeptidase N
LLIDKWLILNAQCVGDGAAARIEALTHHADFRWTTPNKVYALIAGFSAGNTSGFNAADGSGYRFLADAVIRLNRVNPQVAARIGTGFRSYKVLDRVRRTAAEGELKRILSESNLSRDVYEIVSRILGAV